MGKHKKTSSCKRCGVKGVTMQTHYLKCNNHHSKKYPYVKPKSSFFDVVNVKHKLATMSKKENKISKRAKTGKQKSIPRLKPSIKFYHDKHSELLVPMIEGNSVNDKWLTHAANINNMHYINPPADGDCLFHIVSQIALLNNWVDIPWNQLELRKIVSNELRHPSNGVEYVFFHLVIRK